MIQLIYLIIKFKMYKIYKLIKIMFKSIRKKSMMNNKYKQRNLQNNVHAKVTIKIVFNK